MRRMSRWSGSSAATCVLIGWAAFHLGCAPHGVVCFSREVPNFPPSTPVAGTAAIEYRLIVIPSTTHNALEPAWVSRACPPDLAAAELLLYMNPAIQTKEQYLHAMPTGLSARDARTVQFIQSLVASAPTTRSSVSQEGDITYPIMASRRGCDGKRLAAARLERRSHPAPGSWSRPRWQDIAAIEVYLLSDGMVIFEQARGRARIRRIPASPAN